MTTQTFWGTLKIEQCCNCGIYFGMTNDLYEKRRNDHEKFFCPVGHPQYYNGKSDKEKLQEQLDHERRRRERAEQSVHAKNDDLQHEKNRSRALKGVVTKIKKRVGKGVCPCCNRHFSNLEKHMAGQHPQYHSEEVKVTV